MSGLTHIDASGAAHMVDVGGKPQTARRAVAAGRILMSPAAITAVRDGSGPKGEVLATARIAGIMAAKRTADLIPLCHPLPIASISIDFAVENDFVEATATVTTIAQTGIEIEAMTAVSVTLLTIYDMVKAVDRCAKLDCIRLCTKSGGKSGDWQRP